MWGSSLSESEPDSQSDEPRPRRAASRRRGSRRAASTPVSKEARADEGFEKEPEVDAADSPVDTAGEPESSPEVPSAETAAPIESLPDIDGDAALGPESHPAHSQHPPKGDDRGAEAEAIAQPGLLTLDDFVRNAPLHHGLNDHGERDDGDGSDGHHLLR